MKDRTIAVHKERQRQLQTGKILAPYQTLGHPRSTLHGIRHLLQSRKYCIDTTHAVAGRLTAEDKHETHLCARAPSIWYLGVRTWGLGTSFLNEGMAITQGSCTVCVRALSYVTDRANRQVSNCR